MGNNILAVSISHVGNNNGAVQLVPNYVYSAVDGWLDGDAVTRRKGWPFTLLPVSSR